MQMKLMVNMVLAGVPVYIARIDDATVFFPLVNFGLWRGNFSKIGYGDGCTRRVAHAAPQGEERQEWIGSCRGAPFGGDVVALVCEYSKNCCWRLRR